MVNLWPWKGEDNSTASFEKTLSALTTKISKSQTQLDGLRSNARRYKALWTLYTVLAYTIAAIVLVLVVGWQNWTLFEGSALASGPVIIYLGRTGLAAYYTYRTDIVNRRLEVQQAERTKTIDKLKAATKYNSTQELLEKYGGAPKKTPAPKTPKAPKPSAPQPGRTYTGPPATANILRPGQPVSQPSTPQPVRNSQHPQQVSAPPTPQTASPANAEFAPNAFSAPAQYAQGVEMAGEGHWYDRVLDLLLGEDETLPRNRVALICQSCRLVNGQAPPGTKSLADLGQWRCHGCGDMNGEIDEGARVVAEIKRSIETAEEKDDAKDAKTEVVTGVDSGSGEEMIEVKSKKGRKKKA